MSYLKSGINSTHTMRHLTPMGGDLHCEVCGAVREPALSQPCAGRGVTAEEMMGAPDRGAAGVDGALADVFHWTHGPIVRCEEPIEAPGGVLGTLLYARCEGCGVEARDAEGAERARAECADAIKSRSSM